ncbi:MAG: helix-turn-helix transcriptional regulator [Bradymonadales bacterium]|nr:helix-turn-helix transcriptional regulator [Bradymonadales bacterium]
MSPGGAQELLTTGDVANLLRIHPKQVYRLLKRGLPAVRMGGQWRFHQRDVLAWLSGEQPGSSPAGGAEELSGGQSGPVSSPARPPLIAAHGGVAVEILMRFVGRWSDLVMGVVPADRGEALALLSGGRVILAGFHGGGVPTEVGTNRLAYIHLVEREIGLVSRPAERISELSQLASLRLASRPPSAGSRLHLDSALVEQGLDPARIHERAVVFGSHQEVVFAVARGDADVGVSTRSWADLLGLSFRLLTREAYGLLVRAQDLGDPRVIRLGELIQGLEYRRKVGSVSGYDATKTGEIRLGGGI